ncbi:hypothetical protein JCM8208_006319 [Rhodotorula glutinis]
MGRYVVLAAGTVVAISCGLNYCYSAYAPQLANRLGLSSTQTNLVGAAGNLGVYLSSPFIGRIVDRRGPKPTLILAAVALTGGYLVVRAFYTSGDDPAGLYARLGVPGLVAAELLTGIGSTAGLSSAGNSVARSFKKRRAAALSVVLSAFGLSAFFCAPVLRPPSLVVVAAQLTFPTPLGPRTDSTLSSLFLHSRANLDATPAFLLLLAMGSLFSTAVGLAFVRPAPVAPRAADSALVDERAAEEAPVEVEGALREGEEHVPQEPAVVVLPRSSSSPTSTERTPLLRSDSTKSVQERNIAGWALLHELDFWLIFGFNGLCAGVGLCYINNLGTVVRSLALATRTADPSLLDLPPAASVALLQSRLVSLLSIFNFLGRLLSGFLSDTLLHSPPRPLPRIPRVAFLPLTASILVSSQLVALRTAHAEHLWAATALTGLAHGCLFGISGIVGLERFGLKSFSQTNGFLALAPALFGQTTNLLFGRIYDSHVLPSPPSPSPIVAIAGTCTLGRECYAQAFILTSCMALGALVVGLWLALGRKGMRIRAA